jgi:Mn-dependent DtxR family transcriptional regulator
VPRPPFAPRATPTLTSEQVKATIAVAGYTATWYAPPTRAWLAERMNWSETQARAEIEQMRRAGLVEANGNGELRARPEAVTVALEVWRATRERTPAAAPTRERRRRPQWD